MAHMMSVRHGLTLITGGVRSGKSAHAIELAKQSGAPTLYVATAEALDSEMAERIRRHRAGRPDTWRTLEEPLEFARSIEAEAPPGSVVIVDCLTVWLGNLLHDRVGDANEPEEREVEQARQHALSELKLLCRLPEAAQLRLIVVTNEVGSGLVPPNPLGRAYRDLLGEVNQLVARRADKVLLLVSGIPLDLRALAQQ